MASASHSRPPRAVAAAATARRATAAREPAVQDKTCDPDPTACITPPPKPADNPATGTAATTLAVSKLYLGDTDRQGNASPTAWKKYGYNLDGLISTKTGANHCKLVAGANPTNVKQDGDNGIDNSFGSNLLPLITSLASDAATSVNDSISSGSFTIMINMDNLGDPAANADQTGITAELYGGADKKSPALFDGTDVWPVLPELLNDPTDITSSKVKFPDSFLAGGTWVSGSKGDLSLSLSVSGYSLTLKIIGAVITMDVTGMGTAAKATNGTIAGVINTEELINELAKVAGSFDTSLCSGSTFDSIAQQIRQGSDIMSDGTNGDPTKTCDGISIGLGFDAAGVTLGTVADPAPPKADPCADAG